MQAQSTTSAHDYAARPSHPPLPPSAPAEVGNADTDRNSKANWDWWVAWAEAERDARAAWAAAWVAPPVPTELIEELVAARRPETMSDLLQALGVDVKPPPGPGEEARETAVWFDATPHARAELHLGTADLEDGGVSAKAWGLGAAIAARAKIRYPQTEAAAEWLEEVGQYARKLIVTGWTPPVPRTREELEEAIRQAQERDRDDAAPHHHHVEDLGRRLVAYGAVTDADRVRRIAAASRVMIAAVREDLVRTEALLDALEAGDLDAARLAHDEIAASSADVVAEQMDPALLTFMRLYQPHPSDDSLSIVAGTLLRWQHKREGSESGVRALERRLLEALGGWG